ncbi:hypothetical protein [Deinococcus pimensis]|uniref:hypothetical protein n=1 Tax=Deinococcus pimensis TaxID=309888 RepID=UPI0004B4B34D|nr:hypothetical protein [Deinococcus pimensis]
MRTDVRAAFTLAEVLVGVALLALAALLLGYLGLGFSFSRTSRFDTAAQAYARSYYDTVGAFWATRASYDATVLPDPGAGVLGPPAGYSYVVNVKDGTGATLVAFDSAGRSALKPSASVDPLKTVTLTVRTPDRRTLEFVTRFVRPTRR